MWKVESFNEHGTKVTTEHRGEHGAASAALEAIERQRKGHTNVRAYEVPDEKPNVSDAGCQHGPRNKPQRRAERGLGLGNPMLGG